MTEQVYPLAIGFTATCADGSVHESAHFCVRNGKPMFYNTAGEELTGDTAVVSLADPTFCVTARVYIGWFKQYREAQS